ncbi:unnamed protein product [Pleuronectes platessa]|uniref:Uncharacterized protein n=1 Tax=Pleuronectes platessa TaxID=8262 RepID=A0A9N7VFP5_PLEPL|nr:unnamed protein product [Pleuronectes platessa]
MLLIPELEFHELMGEKEQNMADLLHENCVLVYKLQQLQSIPDKRENDPVACLLFVAESRRRATALKYDHLEHCLIAEKKRGSGWSHALPNRMRRSPKSDLHWPRLKKTQNNHKASGSVTSPDFKKNTCRGLKPHSSTDQVPGRAGDREEPDESGKS